MLGKTFAVFSTVLILAVIALILSAFTPHPYLATLLLFSLVRGLGAQLQLNRIARTVALREASHSRLVGRIDRMEWEVIYGAFRNAR